MNTAPASLRLAFAGTPAFAVPALTALLESRHRVTAVFTQPDRPAGRGRTLQMSPIKQQAARHGLDVLQPLSLKTAEAVAMLRQLDVDALVVVAYGLLLPPPVLDVPRRGCFNIHGSLLPRWRGAAPIQRAVLAGDAVTGVSIMRMAVGLDTGPVLATRAVPIADRDTAGAVHDRLALLGAELIVATLDAVADGTARAQPQSVDGVTYAAKIHKAEALIDWRAPALDLWRLVRAFNPWPVAETRWHGVQLRIWDADLAPDPSDSLVRAVPAPPGTVLAASADGIDVACGSGVLRLVRLQLAGRKALPVAEFLKSQPLTGARFGSA